MVKSLQRSLEAKLASIKDPEVSDSEDKETETISVKQRAGKGSKRKKPNASETVDGDRDMPSSVIYLGHLPMGFEEREITVFLNQFGAVKKCRVSRSTKTGRPRGYAFVEFADPEVAQIVAETLSGYFLLEKRLVCHVLPNDKVHKMMFTKPSRVPNKALLQKKVRSEVNKKRTAEFMKGMTQKLIKREELKRKKIAGLGIEYEFPGSAVSCEKEETSTDKNKQSMDVKTEDGLPRKTPKSKKKSKKKVKNEHVSIETTVTTKKKKSKTKHGAVK